MRPGDGNYETRIQAPFIHPGEISHTQTARKKPSMFIRLLKRPVAEEERAKFPIDTGFHKLNDEVPDFSEAQSSVETHQGEEEGADELQQYREVYSNLSYLSFNQCDEAAAAPSAPPSFAPPMVPTSDSSPTLGPCSPATGSVHIPVIYSWDPNLPMEDTRLEPIHAVVSEYCRTLNDAFFGEPEEVEEHSDEELEHQVSRRGKFRRALRGLKRK